MIAMILISLLPTTNNIPNDYQGKRTATLAVPKGKDFIFQVLQVYELKKKLLIPLNILLPLHCTDDDIDGALHDADKKSWSQY